MNAALQSQTPTPTRHPAAPNQLGLLQRKCACGGSSGLTGECADCDKKKMLLQRQAGNSVSETRMGDGVPPIVHEVLRSPGQPLDSKTRAFIEPPFSHDFGRVLTPHVAPQRATEGLSVGPTNDMFEQEADRVAELVVKNTAQSNKKQSQPQTRFDFSDVRVHTNERAALSANAVGALAYTVGQNIVFGSGQFQPSTMVGRLLLAHELTHVVQQSHNLRRISLQRSVGGFLRNIFINVPVFGFLFHFSLEELQAYLKKLDETGKIEDDDDSDNKAAEIAASWNKGERKFVLTARRKALVLREMLSGWVSDDEENAILGLLERSDNPELEYIFGEGQVKHEKILSELKSTRTKLYRFYQRRFSTAYPELTLDQINQGGAPPTKPDLAKLKEAKPGGSVVQPGDKLPETTSPFFSSVKSKETKRRTDVVSVAEADAWINEVYGNYLPDEKKKKPEQKKGFAETNVKLRTESGGSEEVFESFLYYCINLATPAQRRNKEEMEKWKDRCRYEESITAGYFDKEQKEMVVRTDRESPSTRLHEVVHAYADPSVDGKLTRYAKEGLTEYITRQIIARHKTAKNEKRLAFSQSYSGPYDLMLELSLVAGDDALAKAHFQGDVESVANAVGKPVFDSILADMESIDGWQEAVKHLRERKSKQVKIQKKAATRTQEKEWTSRPPQIAQRQIAVGQADDRFEMEADDVAERVMRSSSKEPHTRSRAATKENEIEISRKPNRVEDGNTAHHEKVEIDAQMHGGVPLPSPVRAFFEPIFGHDFSQVRVHTDDRAVESAESVGALAYTAGHDIVFGKGQYAPFTHSGQKLLAHELTHVRQQSHQAGVSTLQRALTAPPKRLITSYSETPSYPTDDEARLDARIAYRQAQALDSGTGMRLGTTDYKNLPQPTPVDPKKPADPNANIERRAVKSAILELVTSDPSVFADSEFRLRVPIDDSPAPYKYAMVVLRFDKDRNVEASYAGTLQESKGSLTDSQFVLPDLTATFGITFKTDSITAKMPGDSAATTFNGKEWSSNDGALLKEALPLLGANERAIISGKIFRRINLDKYKDVAGFYSTGDKSVNLMDSALPWDKSIWFGEGANFYSRAVHTVLHEIGHALHYATAPLTGAAASTKTLMDLFKSAVFAQSKKLTGKVSATTWPPASIKFPTDYASTSWEEFYADSFSIYKTNPSFLATTDYQYLFDFFKLNFP